LKSPKSPRTPKSEEEKEKSQEIKEFPLIQLDDLEITLANKTEEAENTLLIHIRFLKIYLIIFLHKNLTIIKLNHLKKVRKLTHQKKIYQIVNLIIVI